MSDNTEPTQNKQSDQESGIDHWLEPFFTDSALWSVVLVAAGCLGTLGAAVLVAALYIGNYPAIGALLLLAWMSFDFLNRNRRTGKLGRLSRCIIGLWGLSILIAIAGIWLGLA
jgi:hypothetical protein